MLFVCYVTIDPESRDEAIAPTDALRPQNSQPMKNTTCAHFAAALPKRSGRAPGTNRQERWTCMEKPPSETRPPGYPTPGAGSNGNPKGGRLRRAANHPILRFGNGSWAWLRSGTWIQNG